MIQGISRVGVPLSFLTVLLPWFVLFVFGPGFFCHNSLKPFWLWRLVHLAAALVQTFLCGLLRYP